MATYVKTNSRAQQMYRSDGNSTFSGYVDFTCFNSVITHFLLMVHKSRASTTWIQSLKLMNVFSDDIRRQPDIWISIIGLKFNN